MATGLLHDQLTTGGGGGCGLLEDFGLIEDCVLERLMIHVLVDFHHEGAGAAEGEDFVEDAVGELALGHLVKFD